VADATGRPESALPKLDPGSMFAGYRIDSVLDRGGMGVVYKATDLDLDRTVALKIIAPEHTQNETAVARFKVESRLAASLEHPNIVPIHRGGDFEGILYLAMRFVPGTNLRRVIDRGPMALGRIGRIVSQIAGALDAAHARGLVHRDVKPANILVSGEGEHEHIYLTDFGLTKRLGAAAGALTRTGGWVGTPDYVAPEQIQGHNVDSRADVYSLGCVLFEMLTGHVAYPKDSDMAKFWAHVSDPPPLPSTERPDLDEAFDQIVVRATAKDPDDRYPTAGEMAAAVTAAVARQEAEGRRAPAPPIAPAAGGLSATRAESPKTEPALGGAIPPPPPEDRRGAIAASAAAVRPHEPPPPGRPPRRGSASGGWLSRNKWAPVLGVLIIVAGAAVALLSGGGSSGKKPVAAKAEVGQPVKGTLSPVPTNHVTGHGSAVLRLNGNRLAVTVDTSGLLDAAPHAMHIHAGKKGVCPPASAAQPHNGHLSIATLNGGPYYGSPVSALTTRGDTSPKSIVAFNRFPTTGKIHYTRTITVSAVTAAYIRKDNAVLVVHGIDYNHNGIYDGTLERSDLKRSLTGESTAPGLCGPLVAEKTKKSGTKTAQVRPHASGAVLYTASLVVGPPTTPAAPPALGAPSSLGALCHLGDGTDAALQPA
jgi:Protein kinase domain